MPSRDNQIIHETAYAKVNLVLEVLRRRNDGYHEVRSVLQTIDLADSLSFVPGDRIRLLCSTPELQDESNLVIKAVQALREATGCKKGAIVRLNKRIPMAMGLGGGSSDAAATLRALNRLWGLGLSIAELRKIAGDIGSDVPFFVTGGTALVSGRGEQVEPVAAAPPVWMVMLAPPIWMSNKTARLYSLLDASCYTDGEATKRLVQALELGELESSLLFNCFEKVMQTAFTGIENYVASMLDAGASRVHLSGSGPTLFAIERDVSRAEAIVDRLNSAGHTAFLQKAVGAYSP